MWTYIGSPKYWWGFTSDRLTGQDAADFKDLIAEESARAGVDPRLALAILRQESAGHQRWPIPGIGHYWDMMLVGAELVDLNESSIGISSFQEGTFVGVKENHPDVFGSRDWVDLVWDNELAVRAAVWYVHDLRALVVSQPDLRAESTAAWSSTDLIAYGYNGGAPTLGSVIDGASDPGSTSYVQTIRRLFIWADGIYCGGGDFQCG